jgi:anaerobic C4-dicarboxylate transporter
MSSGIHPLVRVKQALNAMIILCIPVGLFFGWGVVNNQISYKYEVQDSDFQEKLSSGNWNENDKRIIDNIAFHRKAAHTTFYLFIALIVVRVGLSVAKSHSTSRVS